MLLLLLLQLLLLLLRGCVQLPWGRIFHASHVVPVLATAPAPSPASFPYFPPALTLIAAPPFRSDTFVLDFCVLIAKGEVAVAAVVGAVVAVPAVVAVVVAIAVAVAVAHSLLAYYHII